MRPAFRLFFLISVAVAGIAPAAAVTLEPGAYKLEWGIPSGFADYQASSSYGDLKPISGEAAKKLAGLSSAKAYWGRMGKFTVIIDESGGTGGGYDAAYVVTGAPALESIDLKPASRLPLKSSGQWREGNDPKWHPIVMTPDDAQEVTTDVTVGEPGAEVTKTAAIAVEVRMRPDKEGKERPSEGEIHLRGCWQGTISTDEGALKVQTVDQNGNGIYGELINSRGMGDVIVLEGASTIENPFPSDTLRLGDVVSYDGKLYVIKVNKIGDTVEVAPYTGDSGKLKVEARDGHGKPIKSFEVDLNNWSRSLSLNSKSGSEFTVPPGQYKSSVSMRTKPDELEDYFGLSVEVKRKVSISKDSAAVLKVGGPIKMVIQPESDTVTAKRGEEVKIPLAFTVGGNDLSYIMVDRNVLVKITNARGKVLLSGKAEFG